MSDLTHFDSTGAAHMVDVTDKTVTTRTAIARGEVLMSAETLVFVAAGTAKKGDVIVEIVPANGNGNGGSS